MRDVYTFYSDPGHGFLAVPLADLKELGVGHLISPYSYQKGGMAYLEEDCDASVFMKAYELKFDKKATLAEVACMRNAACRSYPHFVTQPGYTERGYIEYLYGKKD